MKTRTVLVYADAPIPGRSIVHIINTFFPDTFYAQQTGRFEDIKARLRAYNPCKDIPPHLIVYDSSVSNASKLIQYIQVLRGRYAWEGGMVAILPSSAEKKALDHSAFFGEERADYFYVNVPAHISLTRPLDAAALFEALYQLGEGLSREIWMEKYLARSSFARAARQILAAETLSESNPAQTARLLQTAIRTISEKRMAFSTILSHEDWRRLQPAVETLLENYGSAPEGTVPVRDIPHLLQTIKKILARVDSY